MSLWRMAARKDVTHAEVVGALRAHGCSVHAWSGPGCPDLVVGLHGVTHLVEVKRPLGNNGGLAGRDLNPRQRAWHAAWRGSKPWIIRSASEAVEWVRARMEDES